MDPRKPFKISATRNLDHDHRAILSLLYSPLIEADGVALYHGLYALIDRSILKSVQYPHSFIYDLLMMSPTEFYRVRRKLEATGLLSTHTKDDETIYQIYLPLNAESFIKDSPFAPYLKQKVGEDRFQELKDFFKITRIKLSQYNDITANFDDVFDPVFEKVNARSSYLETKHPSVKFSHEFNADLFIESLPQHLVHPQTRTNRAKERFQQLSYIYNLDEVEMKTLVLQCLDGKAKIDFEELSLYCAKMYQKKPKKHYHKRSGLYDLDYFQSKDPKSVYVDITGMDVPVADAKIIDSLMAKTDLKPEVLNVLIAYVLKELNQQFPVYNYFEKIVAEWKRHNIENAEDAIDYLKEKFIKRKTSQQPIKRSKNELPEDVEIDWFDEYLKKREES